MMFKLKKCHNYNLLSKLATHLKYYYLWTPWVKGKKVYWSFLFFLKLVAGSIANLMPNKGNDLNRVFLQPAPCLAPCLVNFSLYKYGAIRSSAPFHLVNLTRSYTELTRSRPQIAPCLAPYGSVFSSVLGKSDKIFKIWKKSKRLKSALNTQLSMKE